MAANRRDQNQTDESTVSMTASLREKIQDKSLLLHTLDIGDTPQEILRKMLSVRSVVTTTSSFAERMQEAAEAEGREYCVIGQGGCGVVFEQPGKVIVVKRALSMEDGAEGLWNDFVMHNRISDSFERCSQFTRDCFVPKCEEFVVRDDREWWAKNGDMFPSEKDYRVPNHLLIAERILPLPKPIRDSLIDLYCPNGGKENARKSPGNKAYLARVYLGKRRDHDRPPSQFFSLKNFQLHLDQMEEVGLNVMGLATIMTDALAVLHWDAKVDASDVEFVMGSGPHKRKLPAADIEALPAYSATKPNFKKGCIQMWLLDFNQCHSIEMNTDGVAKAVESFFWGNAWYYPRPLAQKSKDQVLWRTFANRYIETSLQLVTKDISDLPKQFIARVVERTREKMAENVNPGGRGGRGDTVRGRGDGARRPRSKKRG